MSNQNNQCGILFPKSFNDHDFDGEDGCLLPYGHEEGHIFRNKNCQLISWQDDYSCKCGCWETDDFEDVCKVFSEVSEDFLTNKITASL